MNDAPTESNDPPDHSVASTPQGKFKPLRIWPPLLILLAAFVLWLLPRVIADAAVGLQMASAMSRAACGILVMLWWLLLSRATATERAVGFLGVGLAFGLAYLLLDESMGMPGVLLIAFPLGMLAFAVGAILFSGVLSFKRTVAAVLLAACGFGFSDLLRSDGMWGEFASLELHWRWQLSHEDQMLARRVDQPVLQEAELVADAMGQWLADPEWSGFRGADRTSRQQGPPILADWSASPPEQIWRIAVGPAWSSFAVAGNLLFTQEQRGPMELVVCYAADSGREIWTQAVETRFYESMGGSGPRATPTLADGKLFAMGANGHLMRLDPTTGDIGWQVDLQQVADRSPPEWGFSSSPLVVESNVIVHAGGKGEKGTLAFDVETGEPTWSAAAGDHSYSSPHLGTIAGEDVVLMLTNTGLDLLDPQTGAQRLAYAWDYRGYRVLQPQVVDGDSILLSTGMGVGTRRIRISNSDGEWAAEELWTSRHLKPDFNDFVIHQKHGYGFDGAIFTCVDLASGKRVWKGGRYDEASFSVGAAYFPYAQGWLGGIVDGETEGEWAELPGDSELGSYNVNAFEDSPVVFDGEGQGRIELEGGLGPNTGMLFVDSADNDSQLQIASAHPRDGGWDVAIRPSDDNDTSGMTLSGLEGNDSDLLFLYVDYDSVRLVGGHVSGADGSTVEGKGDYTLTRAADGQYLLSIPGKADEDGMLLLSNAGLQDGTTDLADRSVLSYEYDDATGNFVIESHEFVSTDLDDPTTWTWPARDTDFYFTWVDFTNPLSPPGSGDPCDLNGDGVCDYDDLETLSTPAEKLDYLTAPAPDGLGTVLGDVNLDTKFNSDDLLDIFATGLYDTGADARYDQGDYDFNGRFDPDDMIEAFASGNYDTGGATSAVPEPTSTLLISLAALGLLGFRRRR